MKIPFIGPQMPLGLLPLTSEKKAYRPLFEGLRDVGWMERARAEP
jgi:hypothetical protein